MDDIISIVRALVIAQKDITVDEVARDFIQLEGSPIPYKKFGFNRLEDFFSSSDEFFLSRVNGGMRIYVKKSEASAHISKLVSQQKVVKKKTKRSLPRQRIPRMAQNMSSYAYSNVYSRMPSRSVARHAMNRNSSAGGSSSKYGSSSSSSIANRIQSSSSNNQGSDKLNGKLTKSPEPTVTMGKGKQNLRSEIVRTISNDIGQNNDNTKSGSSTSKANSDSQSKSNTSKHSSNVINTKTTTPTATNLNKNCDTSPIPIVKTLKQSVKPRINKENELLKSQPHPIPTLAGSRKVTLARPKPTKSILGNRLIKLQNGELIGNEIQVNLMPHELPKSPDLSPTIEIPEIVNFPVMPAINISPIIPVNMQVPVSIDGLPNVFELERFCSENMLQAPVYTYFKLPCAKGIHCRIVLNGISYSTYPNESVTETEAKNAAAKLALDRLKEIHYIRQLPVCMDSEAELTIKIYESIKSFSNGVFAMNIPELFERLYQQSLPNDWLNLIENSPQLFSQETIVGDRKIIYPNINDTTVDELTILPQISENDFSQMDKLMYPWHEKHWNIFVTHPVSTIEIWGRLVGAEYSDKMDSLIIDIEMNLLTNKKIATTITVGCVYLVTISECIHRVRVDRNDNQLRKCLCFRIDVGDEDWFPMDEIYECDSRFFKFPAQAICFTLYGLEDFAENPDAKKHLSNTLSNKILVGDINSTQKEFIEQENEPETMPKIRLILYDTSSDEDICLNPKILRNICDETAPPTLKEKGITNVTISHISDTGEIYCQIQNQGLFYIEKIIHHLTEFDFDKDILQKSTNDVMLDDTPNRDLYLIKDHITNKWFRAEILSTNESEYVMFFVDYGMTRTVKASQLYRLESLSGALNTYPPQSIRIKLHGISEYTVNMVSSLKGYLAPNTTAIVKVIVSQEVPEVNIYKQFEKSSPLSCINEAIIMEEELNKTSEEIIEHNTAIQRDLVPVNKPVGKGYTCILPNCCLPKIHETFNVLVTMTSNPGNLRVCAYDNYSELYSLMSNLQDYGTSKENLPIPFDDIHLGQAYAGLHTDGNWYRIIAKKDCGDSSILAFCCDYGEMVVISVNNIKRLPDEFRQLPKQALKAALHGIKPVSEDWEIEDCLFFQQLAFNKNFASIVENIRNDDVLELTLIDVSTNNDVNINKKLVLENRAMSSITT